MGRKAREMTTDGVHYSDKGYEVIASIINKYL
jgi:lysophospholipase L1-like esterase